VKGAWGQDGLQTPSGLRAPRRHQLAVLHDRAETRPAATPRVSAVPPGPGDTEPGSVPVAPSRETARVPHGWGGSPTSSCGVSQLSHPSGPACHGAGGVPQGVPHRLSPPADIMADKEGVTLSLEEEEEEDADAALAYKTPEKKSLREIQELDLGDESLRKYKQALLGTIPATVGKAGGLPAAGGHPGTPAPRPDDAALAAAGSSGVPRAPGASPAGRARPGWHRPWVLPVAPLPVETPASPCPDGGSRPGDPGCLGYRITAAVSIGTPGNSLGWQRRASSRLRPGARGGTAVGAQTVPPAPHGTPAALGVCGGWAGRGAPRCAG